ncbi:MAG: hypothetical protein ABTQ34_01235 [Bdellovibrionales bacterium]
MSARYASIKKIGLAAAMMTAVGIGGWSAPARADINDIYASNNSIEFRVGGHHLQYRETVNSQTLDTENGWMPSIGGGVSFLMRKRPNSIWNNVYARLDTQFAFGNTDYDGSLQPSGMPYRNTTKSQINDINFKAGYAFPLGGMAMVIPYAEFGYHYWLREMTGVYGYTEHYDHTSIMAGALLQYSPFSRWIYSLSVQGGTTMSPQMRTGGVDYDLSERAAWATEGRVSYAVTARTEVFGVAGYNEFSYGKSAVQTSGSYEPDSKTREVKTFVGVAYRF